MLSLRFLLKHETGLGWFAVGNAGVVVDWACDLSMKRAWASVCGWKRRRGGGGLGLRSQRGGGLGLPILVWWWLRLADLADLGLGLPISATPQRKDAGHTAKHELHLAGHAVKHKLHPAGQALPCRSQRSGGGAVPILAGGVGGKDLFGWLFLVAEKFHLCWFLVAEKFHL